MKTLALQHDMDRDLATRSETDDDARMARPRALRKAKSGPATGQQVQPAGPSSGFSTAINAGLLARAAEGSGQALPEGLRTTFERSLGTDLGGVRVHTHSAAAAATDALEARAYAVGQDVFMGAGEYNPDSEEGALLLAHEVAHTVQQQGATSGPQYKLEVSEAGDAMETDADAAASAMVRGESANVMRVAATAGARKVMRTPRGPHTEQNAFAVRSASPIGIESSPIRPRLDALVTTVEAELAAWRQYLRSPNGPRPGRRAYNASVALARDLPSAMPGDFHGYDRRVALYLAHRIGMDQGFLVDDMTAFNPDTGAMTLRELFGLSTTAIPHPVFRYRLEVRAGHVYRFGVPVLSASLQFHDMVVSCEARIDGRVVMTYRQALDTQQAGVQGGGAITRGGGEGPGGTHDNELTSSESEWVTSPNYLAPDFFTPGFASVQGSAGVQAGAAHHQASVGASAQIIKFGGTAGISFELTSLVPPNIAAGQSTERSPNGSIGAGIEVGPGHSSLHGPATGTAGPERHAAGGNHRTNDSTLLSTTTLYFDTEREDIGTAGSAELQSLVARVRAFRAQHPDCHFELEVIANASPRWRGAPTAARAAELNGQLSQRRATAVVTDLQTHLGATDCSYRSTVRFVPGDIEQDEYGETCDGSGPLVDPQGSDEALQQGVGQHEDPQEWRSVVIHVYRNVYEQDYIQGYRQP